MTNEMNDANLLGNDSVWDVLWGSCAEHVVGYSLERRQAEVGYVIGVHLGELQGRWILMQSDGGSSVDERNSCVPGFVLARAPAPCMICLYLYPAVYRVRLWRACSSYGDCRHTGPNRVCGVATSLPPGRGWLE
jgi:hypothetical protein